MKLPKTLSASSLNLYLSSPLSWYYKYVLGIKEGQKSVNLVWGSALHEALAAFHTGKPYVRKIWNTVKREGQSLEGLDIEKTYTEVLKVMKLYEKEGPHFDADQVEKKRTVFLEHPTTREKLEVPFIAKMDMTTKDGMVVDHKSTSSELKKLDWAYKNQGTAYWMTYKILHGKRPEYFVCNQVVKLKRTPRFVQNFYQFTLDEEYEFFELCRLVIKKIQNEDWYSQPLRKSFYPPLFKNLII